MWNNNVLARLFEWLGETFEKFNPAAFRFLAAFLPYLTPFPVAWLTMKSAEQFLDFTPSVAFIFVFALEGLGLWFTSLLVDSLIDWIRNRNIKVFSLVVLFGAVVSAYIFLLVNLNVTLKGGSDPVLQEVITLLCFLPLLSGIGNGYYKWKLEQKDLESKKTSKLDERDEKIRQEQNDLKLKRAMIKQGMNPMQVYQTQVDTVSTPQKHGDWRSLTQRERSDIGKMTAKEVMDTYGVGESTAFRWKQWSKTGR